MHRLPWASQIIASLTRENLAERGAEIGNLPWTQMEKNSALAKCRLGLRAWRAKKPLLCLHAVTDEDGHPPENEDESGRRLCEYWCTIFQACVEGQRHHHYENILWYVQKAPDDILWVIEKKKTSLTNSWPQRRNLLLVLMEFRTAFAGVRYNHVWVVLSVRYLPKVELYLFPSPPTSTTMEEL